MNLKAIQETIGRAIKGETRESPLTGAAMKGLFKFKQTIDLFAAIC